MELEYRNAKFNAVGSIDLEWNHPVYGWIPFGASPNDVEAHGREFFELAKETAEPYVAPVAPAPTSADVDAERDRRITAGFSFNGVAYQSRPEDRENIMGASTAAVAAISAGAQPGDYRWANADSDFLWIAADNTMHLMDAQTMFAFGQAAMAHKQTLIFAGRAIKDMSPIPADFATNEAYWPAVANS